TVLLMTIQGPPVECLIVLIITWMRQLQGGVFGIYDIRPPRCHSFEHGIGNPCLTCCVRSCEVTTIEHSSPDAKPAGQTKPDLTWSSPRETPRTRVISFVHPPCGVATPR